MEGKVVYRDFSEVGIEEVCMTIRLTGLFASQAPSMHAVMLLLRVGCGPLHMGTLCTSKETLAGDLIVNEASR